MFFDVQLILEECRSKHFMFPMFCIFLCWLHIEHIWVFTCLYFPKNVWEVYVLEFCTKYMNGNYVLNIFGDLFPKDLLVWICSGDVLQQVSSRNIFGIYLYVHIFPNIFSMKHFGDIFQKRFWKYNDSREMLQKSYRFLMKYCYEMASRRCFVANIWNICIHTRNMFEEYNCGYSQKLTYWGIFEVRKMFGKHDWPKLLFWEIAFRGTSNMTRWEKCLGNMSQKMCLRRNPAQNLFWSLPKITAGDCETNGNMGNTPKNLFCAAKNASRQTCHFEDLHYDWRPKRKLLRKMQKRIHGWCPQRERGTLSSEEKKVFSFFYFMKKWRWVPCIVRYKFFAWWRKGVWNAS